MLQFYAVSCDASVNTADLVSAQCVAIPLDCTEESLINPSATEGGDIQSVINLVLANAGVSCLSIHHLKVIACLLDSY